MKTGIILRNSMIGFEQIRKERNQRIKNLQEKVTELEAQNNQMEKELLEIETKHKTVVELYTQSQTEYNEACLRIKDVNSSKTNFELLCEHRLTKIKDLEREIYLKSDKIMEFRNRFEQITQKLLQKDEIIHDLNVEKDKIESQFQKFKESILGDTSRGLNDSPKTFKEKQEGK